MATKILIVKMGFSETLDKEIGKVPSLGDVLRTTPILWGLKEKYSDSHITWLVAEQAEPLLHGNKLIDRILVWDQFVPFQIMREKFDVLINLEKIAGVAALTDMIDAWTKYGFRFEGINGDYHAYERGLNFIDYIEKKNNTYGGGDSWQKILIEMMGIEWKGQEYIIGYEPKTKDIHDIGLNYKVGSKWPTKAMSREKWEELEVRLLEEGYSLSWQEGIEDLYGYMDWINSNKVIITQDSLGLHLALALKKRVIGLFGPTDPKEVYFYGNAKAINTSSECEYKPCNNQECINNLNCMEDMNMDELLDAVKSVFKDDEMKVTV